MLPAAPPGKDRRTGCGRLEIEALGSLNPVAHQTADECIKQKACRPRIGVARQLALRDSLIQQAAAQAETVFALLADGVSLRTPARPCTRSAGTRLRRFCAPAATRTGAAAHSAHARCRSAQRIGNCSIARMKGGVHRHLGASHHRFEQICLTFEVVIDRAARNPRCVCHFGKGCMSDPTLKQIPARPRRSTCSRVSSASSLVRLAIASPIKKSAAETRLKHDHHN